MKRLALIAAALTGLTLTAPAAQAGGAGASLPACYHHVINACNASRHPESCSQAGMNACDDYHKNNKNKSKSAPPQELKIQMVAKPGGKYRAILKEVKPVREIETLKPIPRPRPDPAPFGGRGWPQTTGGQHH
ncbi:MAG: hypothetical protein R3D85_01085 [Paracoccaceae bacterium]